VKVFVYFDLISIIYCIPICAKDRML